MAGYNDYQTEEEYIAASKRRVTMADTKELVEQVRALALLIDPLDVNGRDAVLLKETADALERLERERDEWRDAAHLSACEAHSGLLDEAEAEASTLRARVAKMEEALRAIDAKIVDLGLAAQRKANGHKHEKFAAVRHSMRLIVSAALTEEQP